MMNKLIIRPVKGLSEIANEVSLGKMDIDIDTSGTDEIGELSTSFNRIKLSLQKTINRLSK